MEEDSIFSCNDVTDSISIVSNRTKSSSCWDTLWMFPKIDEVLLAMRGLWRRQPPWFTQDLWKRKHCLVLRQNLQQSYLSQEWRVNFKVLWNNVQTEKVSVDSLTTHGGLITSLMNCRRLLHESDFVLFAHFFITHGSNEGCRVTGYRSYCFSPSFSE